VEMSGQTDRYFLRSFIALRTVDTAKKPDSELLTSLHVHVTAATVFAKIQCSVRVCMYVMTVNCVFFNVGRF
jgi:hypothetical protein